MPSPRVSWAARQRCAEVYRLTCARLGRVPSPEICSDLADSGALLADLQLCRDVEAVALFLREAPAGVHQLVLYNGSAFFGKDPVYRAKLMATKRRMPHGVLGKEARLRELIVALATFCSLRGSGLAVLELSGVPLGPQALAPPLAAMLPDLRALQRLHLSGCGLKDRGLATLLPHLLGGLPKLSHLSLARNGLHDARLISKLLVSRAAAQRRRQAVPFNILDLSQNPRLGACRANSQWAGCPPWWPAHKGTPGALFPAGEEVVTRESLLEFICEAFRAGLLLKTLRLRSMMLSDGDLRPLLHLLYEEASHRQAGHRRGFPLQTVSFEGNHLEPELLSTVASGLQTLACRGRPRGRPPDGAPPSRRPPPCTAPTGPTTAGPALPGSSSRPRTRSQSLPCPSAEPAMPERDALSDGEFDEAGMGTALGGGAGSRADAKQRFREDCAVLTRRLEARASLAREKRSRHPPHELRRLFAVGQPPPLAAGDRSSRGSAGSGDSFGVIALGAIPDRGAELGFGPPLPAMQLPAASAASAPRGQGRSERHGNGQGIELGAIPDRARECGFTPHGPEGGIAEHEEDEDSIVAAAADLARREMELFQHSEDLGDFDEALWAFRTREALSLFEEQQIQQHRLQQQQQLLQEEQLFQQQQQQQQLLQERHHLR
uniref:Uncharacterized protein n=1 Tax=Alexandrium monilatum TaxID=311494 RepID=A0A7S4W962_9DINO